MIGTIGLGVPYVNGRSRVPSPPTKTIACTAGYFDFHVIPSLSADYRATLRRVPAYII